MEEINEQDLMTAITLGDSICKDLGVCCKKKGEVIFQLFQTLKELHLPQGSGEQPAPEIEPPQEGSSSAL